MGNEQSGIWRGAQPRHFYAQRFAADGESGGGGGSGGAGEKEAGQDLQRGELMAAERRHRQYLNRFQDAYGDDEGLRLFRAVLGRPSQHAHDYRRLVSGLARDAMSSATRQTKEAILTSGLLDIYDEMDGKGWREQAPGWSRHNKASLSSWCVND
jgi:hypothetical protein